VPDALSRTSSVTDGKGQQRTCTYDALDRVTALTYPAYTTGNVSMVYDADGNTTSMTDSTGITSYAYDALNLVTSLTEPNNVVTSFGYDANHQRTSTTYPDGVVMSQSYDNCQRRSSIFSKNPANTTLTSFVYTYTNPATNTDSMLPYKITEQDSLRNVTVTQGYDKLNRMTSWVVQKSDLTYLHSYFYQFDGVGNRTQIIADPVNSTAQIVGTPANGQANSNESDLTFNAPSEISQIVAYGPTGPTDPTHPAITTSFTYDATGNQTGNNGGNGTSPKPATLTYLPTNQTQSISNTNQDAVTMTWTGTGQGQRVKRTWTDHTTSTSYSASFTYSLLGMSGRKGLTLIRRGTRARNNTHR